MKKLIAVLLLAWLVTAVAPKPVAHAGSAVSILDDWGDDEICWAGW